MMINKKCKYYTEVLMRSGITKTPIAFEDGCKHPDKIEPELKNKDWTYTSIESCEKCKLTKILNEKSK